MLKNQTQMNQKDLLDLESQAAPPSRSRFDQQFRPGRQSQLAQPGTIAIFSSNSLKLKNFKDITAKYNLKKSIEYNFLALIISKLIFSIIDQTSIQSVEIHFDKVPSIYYVSIILDFFWPTMSERQQKSAIF